MVTGPRPQGRQLVLLLPTEDYDLDKDALVGIARGVQWWIPGTPVSCRVVNRSKVPGAVPTNRVVARLVAMNTRDTARFNSLLHQGPSTTDPPSSPQASHTRQPSAEETDEGPPTAVRVEDANYGQLSLQQKQELEQLLQHFIDRGLFPNDPKRVPACVGGELQLPLIDENCTPVAERQRTFTPEEVDMIRHEVDKLTERGIIRPSNSQWAAQVVCVRKSDGTLRLCVDWRKLNALLKTDSGGLGDIQRIFSNLKGKTYFTQMDLASGFHQITIAEKDRPKTAFRDADGQLHEFNRAGLGLTVLPAAFTRIVKKALALPLPGLDSWLDDILLASYSWEQHLAALREAFTRLLNAKLSVNFAKCRFAASSQEFLGMVIDCTGIRPAPSKLEAVSKMPRPRTVGELRAFLGLTGYLRQFVPKYSLVAAPLTDLLRNKASATKRARKTQIEWGDAKQQSFVQMKAALASPEVLAFQTGIGSSLRELMLRRSE